MHFYVIEVDRETRSCLLYGTRNRVSSSSPPNLYWFSSYFRVRKEEKFEDPETFTVLVLKFFLSGQWKCYLRNLFINLFTLRSPIEK